LNVLNGKPIDRPFQKALAALANEYQHVQYGIAVDARNSLNGANGVAFHEQPDYLSDLLSR
jgi:hypothetical protein